VNARSWAEERLKEKGLRVTQPRVAVLSCLAGSENHPTAEEVGAAVNRLVPTAARASIYNVLHSLKDAGLVRELVFDDAVVRFDANTVRHHHFVCTSCGGVADVPWDTLPPLPKRRLPGGQSVESYAVTLRGVCVSCSR
jgi:Fur family transcriptional regulator, peroxide stress response regulator